MKTIRIVIAVLILLGFGSVGCHQHKKTRTVTIEGPKEKHVIKIEKTETHSGDDEEE